VELVLGTANFGNNYGVLNKEAGLGNREVESILRTCKELNIKRIDTAVSYGNSQSILGELNAGRDFQISTKIPGEVHDLPALKKIVQSTFTCLRTDYIETLFFHSIDTVRLPTFGEMIEYLESQVSQKRIGKIGVSVYSESEILDCMKRYPGFGTFQINENILDRRKSKSDALLNLASAGVHLGVRSIFLQGLLLANSDAIQLLPKDLGIALMSFQKNLEELDLDPLDACLTYAKKIPWASSITVGVQSRIELLEISKAFSQGHEIDFEKFDVGNDFVVDPRRWAIARA
jgi:aryl-alcohol dehydrogenase-like predicted oxidoreductase